MKKKIKIENFEMNLKSLRVLFAELIHPFISTFPEMPFKTLFILYKRK